MTDRILKTEDEYREAVRRVADLRGDGEVAEENEELAELEGAIARYVGQPGKPARRKGHPKNGGEDAM